MKNITTIILVGFFIPVSLSASLQKTTEPKYERLTAFFAVKYRITSSMKQTAQTIHEDDLDEICKAVNILTNNRSERLAQLALRIWNNWEQKKCLQHLFDRHSFELFECSLIDNNDLFIKKAVNLGINISKKQAPGCFRLALQYQNLPMLELLIKRLGCNPNIAFKNPNLKKKVFKTPLLVFFLEEIFIIGKVPKNTPLGFFSDKVHAKTSISCVLENINHTYNFAIHNAATLESFVRNMGYDASVIRTTCKDPNFRENVLETTPLRFALDMFIESITMKCDEHKYKPKKAYPWLDILQFLAKCEETDINFSPEGTYTPLAEIASYCLHPLMQNKYRQHKLVTLANLFIENGADWDACYGKSILVNPCFLQKRHLPIKPREIFARLYKVTSEKIPTTNFISLKKNTETHRSLTHTVESDEKMIQPVKKIPLVQNNNLPNEANHGAKANDSKITASGLISALNIMDHLITRLVNE